MNTNQALNILDLKGTVTKDQLSKAYKKMAVKYHPDRNLAGVEMMKIINSAYEFLKGLNLEEIKHTDEKNSYDYSEDLEVVISEILKMQGVEIEICGNWIWLSGNTKEYKDKIKSLGCFWASQKKKWYYRPAEYKSFNRSSWNMEAIRAKYGSSKVKNQNLELTA
ncbi:hypothetical protein HEMROJRC1_20590 [Rodentibacter sp. JRC1]|uniref:J domain-containing protein n=1 Tax=Rodentibacter sp. JRC1 TaxID=2874504 RepID=UPI001CFD0F8A|nr:J domain-containing protein [Rodentibacter sp. JRC1]GJI56947.1 hypothetical protein HEMROJRC1_20590 [Rodentibacter sp. JRC1]